MKRRYLEVTFRGGKPLAAYLYLPRKRGSRVASTRDAGHGLRVDWSAADEPMGIEITAPSLVSLELLNEVLAELGQPPLAPDDWAPANAA